MFLQRGRRWARTAAALVAGGALAFGLAGPARAADEPTTGVAVSPEHTGVELVLNGKEMKTSELALTIDGRQVRAYCIDFHTAVKLGGTYAEGDWAASGIAAERLGKVQWVLTHGYPNGDPAALLAAAGATLPAGVGAEQRDVLLYFGTQTAIWTFSDDVVLGDRTAGVSLDAPQYDVIKKVHDYLVAHATDQPEPKTELTVAPAKATANAGAKAGPFTVKGPAGEITVAATGGRAVDEAGEPVTTTTNGGRFWLTRDGAGEVSVTLTAREAVSFGRVFLYPGGKAQKLILGDSTGETVRAQAAASFAAAPASPSATPTTASPSPSESAPAESPSPAVPAGSPAPSTSPAGHGGALPLTGSPIAAAATVGVLLLAAGAVTVLIVRRRKVRFTA
ncbi:thioester domain-containing protein [Micromonospora auratinigra]|uniref:TQXA domain-containing protein n=1 Tax=Micromonospora auratinigra TaxID=261654 RepID=A0A1A8ZU93_9ACTN|nr:thioester domain-containing protein [Micromonospora auratinigra]SBT47482.1 TQXA domain-containing protein [Micromonospora auratinigra]